MYRLVVMDNKKDMVKPLLLKLGVGVALSFAGYLYKTHLRNQCTRPLFHLLADGKLIDNGRAELKGETPRAQSLQIETKDKAFETSPKKICYSTDEKGQLSQELVSTQSQKTDDEAKAKEQEIISLRNMVTVLQERERNLEIQVLEYCGFKEQEAIVLELHNRLKINTMEAELYNVKIESLKVENQSLKAQAAENSRLLLELESMRAKLRLMKRKMKIDAEQASEQLSNLQQIVLMLQGREREAMLNNEYIQEKLKRLDDLEYELSGLKTEVLRLQDENSELAKTLESAQHVASLAKVSEARALEEANKQRQERNDMEKEMDQLRMNHGADIEELVHLRWVNACLRYELRNCKTPSVKTLAKNISKEQSPESEVTELILEYASLSTGNEDNGSKCCSSTQVSTLTEAIEGEDVSISSNKRHHNKNTQKVLTKLKKLFSTKNNNQDRTTTSSTRTPTNTSLLQCFSLGSLEEGNASSSFDHNVSPCTTNGDGITLRKQETRNLKTMRNSRPERTSQSQSCLLLDVTKPTSVDVGFDNED